MTVWQGITDPESKAVADISRMAAAETLLADQAIPS